MSDEREKVRCRSCELVQWSDRANCRRCGTALPEPIVRIVERVVEIHHLKSRCLGYLIRCSINLHAPPGTLFKILFQSVCNREIADRKLERDQTINLHVEHETQHSLFLSCKPFECRPYAVDALCARGEGRSWYINAPLGHFLQNLTRYVSRNGSINDLSIYILVKPVDSLCQAPGSKHG